MAENAEANQRLHLGGLTAVVPVEQAEARRIARAAPQSGVVVDPMKVSTMARLAGCDPALMRRAIRKGIAEDLAAAAARRCASCRPFYLGTDDTKVSSVSFTEAPIA